MTERLKGVIELVTGGNRCIMDMVAWHIDPSEGQGGFTPHRDRHFGSKDDELVKDSFKPDGTPKYCTCWIALSDATPDNGCLYVIPQTADPGSTLGDGLSVRDPNAIPADQWGLRPGPSGQPIWAPNSNAGLRHVRAVPLSPGGLVVLGHRVLHWGSQGRAESAHGPRISFSFASAATGFEDPYIRSRGNLPYPPLKLRMAFASAQMISYSDRFAIPATRFRLYVKHFRRAQGHFRRRYRERISCAIEQREG
eukprot:8131069-Pyramimonas_sp.AAC.1